MFKVICLQNCPFSEQAAQFFQTHANPSDYNLVWVDHETKQKYKTSEQSTFPQIYYIVKHGKKKVGVRVGGYDQLRSLWGLVKTLKQMGFNEKIVLPLRELMKMSKQ